MATTPLIKTPQVDGGTFYTFSSAARDLSKTLNNENLRLVFSKFACINLPDFDRLDVNTFSNFQNFMQFDTIDGMIANGGLKSDPNINFTESLQNYALNLEELILSNTNYDNTTNRSVSERVFFKWLKETGAMRFRSATNLEKNQGVTRPLFVEEDEVTSGLVQYRRVVKYLGEIDIVNNVDKAGEAYTELYMNVPTEVGSTPTVLFDSISDTNYKAGLKIKGADEFIVGRNGATVHPQGLSKSAFYDYDQPLTGSGSGGYSDSDANWMDEPTPPTTTDTYFTEPTTFTNVGNADIQKQASDYDNPVGFSAVAYRRNQLDGISLDFTPTDYQQISSNPTIATIQEFNGIPESKTFEFNAILLYYDMVDLSNQDNNTTNLYGILLLDNITPKAGTAGGGFIQRFPKYKPNRVTGQNGNSYGFKLNLRFDASPGTAGIDTIVNDYNTFSMGLFADAVAQLQESAKIFQRQQIELSELEVRVEGLENVNDSVSTIASLQGQITSLKTQVENASLAFSNSTALLDLIAKNADEIQALANGEVTQTLQYNTNVVKSGNGIFINTQTPNKIRIDQITQEYAFMSTQDLNGIEINALNPLNLNVSSPSVYAELLRFTNMLRINTINTAGGDLLIYIDDESIQFKTGQTIRITFDSTLAIGSRNIKIYSDSTNRLNSGIYGKLVATIPNAEISQKPIIELICKEQGVLEFVYDIIK
tara:strand:- start:78154 stop:80277 length:2124 start_codon:yes stop_codon:yes gene_type:complete